MNTLTYKGYTARIEFDERDNILVGRVLGLPERISFHGENAAELRSDFEAAINFYIADCAATKESTDKTRQREAHAARRRDEILQRSG